MARKPKLTLVSGGGGGSSGSTVEELAKAKLQSSGLTLADGKRLGMSWHDEAETMTYTPGAWSLPSLRIPYFQPNASGLTMSAHPGWPAFYRIRALREPEPKPDNFSKYIQPKDTGVCAYFPRIIDWEKVSQDWRIPLVITEGELKSAKACLEGFPTIGLGGVNSYRASARGYDLLPALEALEWARRPVTIIYDSDLQTNPNVCWALNDLAETLLRRGAIPKMVLLPQVDPAMKMGLDDFLVANHPDLLARMIADESIHITVARTLWALNEKYAYVQAMDRVVTLGETYLSAPQGFRNAITDQFPEQELRPDGSVSTTRISAADAWMGWPMRAEVQSLTYDPSRKPLTVLLEGAGKALYNTWTGWGAEPLEGDVTPFLELVDHLFSGAEPEAKTWFLRWCAYPIQNPGTKLFSSVVIHGIEQGTGKSLIGYTLGAIYGRNFTEISQSDLHGNFNEWAVGRQLVMGDDVTGSDKVQDRDRLKKMITQQEIRINAKNQPTYVLPDCINYLWTSNQPDSFFLEDKDRRFFIHEANASPKPATFYRAYLRWLWKDPVRRVPGVGAAAVHHYLKTLDLGDFDPAGKALYTQAKDRMTRNARSELANWVRDLIGSPDNFLRVGEAQMPGDLFTNKQLMAAWAARAGEEEAKRTPSKRLASELARAGAKQVHGGGVIAVPGQSPDRYYAIRNVARWVSAPLADIQAHLGAPSGADELPRPGKKKTKKF